MKVYKTLDNGIKIVEYEDSYAGAVADMWNQSSSSWGGNSSLETAEQIITRHSGASHINVYLAMLGEEVVGYSSFSRYYKDANTLYLSVLNVRPDYHGKKVGKELVLMCVERTIELGYPRLDIHTWPGNTKAVPLYKKCGYFWEDRTDSTHLSNFIPTVLSTELTKDFFKTASWYDDSTRVIEVKPDGVKLNKFEVYQYSWEKDGAILHVGFENTGRRMRLVETNDYKIEFIAENHELAFGLDYECSFHIVNKTRKELEIQIAGKDDGIIRFNYHAHEKITGEKTLKAQFYVSEIQEEQDTWRMHPCVLADISINKKHAEFGLGIEAKYPIKLTLSEQYQVPHIGMTVDCYVNVDSSLLQKAEVQFVLPENNLVEYSHRDIKTEINAKSKASVAVKGTIKGYGYKSLPVIYDITLDDGRKVSFTKPLHIAYRSLTGLFSYENDNEYCISSGPWLLCMSKKDNFVYINHLTGHKGTPNFPITRLGKPYTDEFDITKPVSMNMYQKDEIMVMEATFISSKYEGIEVTEIFTLSPAGVITRSHRVKNTFTQPKSVILKDEVYMSLGEKTVFNYNGEITEIKDGMAYGLSGIKPDLFCENWIFENDPRNPRGIFWPQEYKFNCLYGDAVFFEHDTGLLPPGESYETKPVVFVQEIFSNYNDFRNYALKTYNRIPSATQDHVEFRINNYNMLPSAEESELVITTNRSTAMEGEISVALLDTATGEPLEKQLHINKEDNTEKTHTFNIKHKEIPDAQGLNLVEMKLDLANYKKTQQKVLFVRSGSIQTSKDNGILTVSNGAINFKLSSDYSDALYSLEHKGIEWLFSKYPKKEPYAWWNPFIGGIQSFLPKFGNILIAREKFTSEFTEQTDCFGNLWSGVSSTVSIDAFDEYKGISYTQYYLTIPGLPVLCVFIRVCNQTGEYKWLDVSSQVYINGGDSMKNLYCEAVSKDHTHYLQHMGSDDSWKHAYKLVKVMNTQLESSMFVYKDTDKEGSLYYSGDNKIVQIGTSAGLNIANGAEVLTRPLFIIFTKHSLTVPMLEDMGRIMF